MRVLSILVIALLGITMACSSPGSGGAATTVIPQTQGAQTVGRDQGQASAAETGSANTQSNPTIINALAAKRVTVNIQPGTRTEVAIEAAEDSEVSIGGGEWGLMKWGNENTLSADVSSGGGAAGGVGGASRAGQDSSGPSPVNTPPTPATPATPTGP